MRKFPFTALYTALQKIEELGGPSRYVRFKNLTKVYICRLSFPIASFTYSPFIGANTLPGDR